MTPTITKPIPPMISKVVISPSSGLHNLGSIALQIPPPVVLPSPPKKGLQEPVFIVAQGSSPPPSLPSGQPSFCCCSVPLPSSARLGQIVSSSSGIPSPSRSGSIHWFIPVGQNWSMKECLHVNRSFLNVVIQVLSVVWSVYGHAIIFPSKS